MSKNECLGVTKSCSRHIAGTLGHNRRNLIRNGYFVTAGSADKNGGSAKNGGWQCQKIEKFFIGLIDSPLHESWRIVVKKGT